MMKKALASALSLKVKNKEMIAVSDLSKIKKTKEASTLINKLKLGKKRKITFILSKQGRTIAKMLTNIAGVEVAYYEELNPYKVYDGGVLILDKEIFAV